MFVNQNTLVETSGLTGSRPTTSNQHRSHMNLLVPVNMHTSEEHRVWYTLRVAGNVKVCGTNTCIRRQIKIETEKKKDMSGPQHNIIDPRRERENDFLPWFFDIVCGSEFIQTNTQHFAFSMPGLLSAYSPNTKLLETLPANLKTPQNYVK